MNIQVQDLRAVPAVRWPYPGARAHNLHEFSDPVEGRVVRIIRFVRATPEAAAPAKDGGGEERSPRHRHNFDQLYLKVLLPLPATGGSEGSRGSGGSGRDPIEPIGGDLEFRPESVWYGPAVKKKPAPETGAVTLYCGIQTQGASGEPFITKEQVQAAAARLSQGGGSFREGTGDHVAADGTVRDFYEITWETAVGRPIRYAAQALTDTIMTFPLGAYPWRAAGPGVGTKSIASFAGGSPRLELVKLASGARLDVAAAGSHEVTAILAGRVRLGGRPLADLQVLYAPPDAEPAELVADEPTLLWRVGYAASRPPVPTGR